MTIEKLEAIEAREQAATPGPWEKSFLSEDYGAGYCMTTFFVKQPDGNLYRIGSADTSEKYIEENSNAEFVAHARPDVPALIAEVKRLNAEVERMTREYDSAVADVETLLGEIDNCLVCGPSPSKNVRKIRGKFVDRK